MGTKINPEAVDFARQQLDNLALLRKVSALVTDGETIEAIAEDLGVDAAEAKRTVFRAFVLMNHEGIPLSPAEIIYQAAVGEIPRGKMLDLLVRYSYTYARDAEPDNPLSARTIGSWDDLMVCHHRGLISMHEIETIIALRADMRKEGLL